MAIQKNIVVRFQNWLWVYGMAWMSVRFPGLKFCSSPPLGRNMISGEASENAVRPSKNPNYHVRTSWWKILKAIMAGIITEH